MDLKEEYKISRSSLMIVNRLFLNKGEWNELCLYLLEWDYTDNQARHFLKLKVKFDTKSYSSF
jgi:hypothetical protein